MDSISTSADQGGNKPFILDVPMPIDPRAEPLEPLIPRLRNLSLASSSVATVTMRLLIDHPSPPPEYSAFAHHLRQMILQEGNPKEQAAAACMAADECKHFGTEFEYTHTQTSLYRMSQHLHPSCKAYVAEVHQALRQHSKVKLILDEPVVYLQSPEGTEDDQVAMVKRLMPMWIEMIELAACATDEEIDAWSDDEKLEMVNAIRCYYALVLHHAEMAWQGKRSRPRQRNSSSHPTTLTHYTNVGLTLWRRIERVRTEDTDGKNKAASAKSTLLQQRSLLFYLEDFHPADGVALMSTPMVEAIQDLDGPPVGPDISNEAHTTVTSILRSPQAGTAKAKAMASSQERVPGYLQVIEGPIPKSYSREDIEVIKSFAPLADSMMPVAAMPKAWGVDEIMGTLQSEFPWAEQATKEIGRMLRLRALFGSPELMLTPILLVGPPGSGKSRMARRLAELLQLPFLNIAVGGSHDSKVLMGTSRGWSTGMPTPLLTPLLQHKTASALVLLDELDKPGSGNEGPSAITSVLLGLMEPETAARYRDPFLLTSCNLSRLIYVGTANSLQMPKPLLSRFTVVLVPEPRAEDRAALAQSMLNDVAKDMGVDHRLMPEIPSELSDGFSGNARAFKSVLIRFLHDWAMEQLGPGRAH